MRRILPALILSSLTLFSFLFLTSSFVSADTSVTATATVQVGSACSFNSVVNSAHAATIPSGTNQSDIGQTTFTVVCNDTGGYSIYAIGYSNFEVGNTKLLATINGVLNSTYDINTGSNASGTPSSWAMKLAPSTNLTSSNILNGYGSYSVVPSSYVKVATLVPSSTPVSSSSLTATYRVNIAATQPAGNYNGKVRYVLVNPATNVPNEPHTCASNNICYWPNGGDMTSGGVGVVDSMGDQSITSSTTSATLWASNFQRPGYGFAGWSDAYDYVVNQGSESNPNAHIYGPNEDITFTAGQYYGTNKGLSLYAVWVESEGYLQNWNGCSSLGQGKVTALTDQRDSDVYAVAKLADGKCWMIENLRLDAADSRVASLSQGFGGVFAGLADPETANFSSSTTANSLYYSGTQSGTASIDIGTANSPGFRMPRYNNNNTNSNSTINSNVTVSNMTDIDQNVYSYGNYYTWPVALANTYYYSGPDTLDVNSNTSETANTSICPSGWVLPRSGDKSRMQNGTNDFYTLSLAQTGVTAPTNYSSSNNPYWINSSGNTEGSYLRNILLSYPNNFINAGFYYGSSAENRGYGSNYTSSTASDSGCGYEMRVNSGNVHPASVSEAKFVGLSVRCMIRVIDD